MQGDVDQGVADEVDGGALEEAEELVGVGVVVGAKCRRVTGGNAIAHARANGAGGDDFEKSGVVVVDFVAVDVDQAIVLFCPFKNAVDGLHAIFAGEFVVGDAADYVYATGDRFLHQAFVLRATIDAVLRKCHELQGDPVFDSGSDFEESIQSGQAGFADIDVATDVENAVASMLLQGFDRPVLYVFEGDVLLAIAPDFDAFKQCAALVPAGLSGGEGGVEVDVGFDEGGADEFALEV